MHSSLSLRQFRWVSVNCKLKNPAWTDTSPAPSLLSSVLPAFCHLFPAHGAAGAWQEGGPLVKPWLLPQVGPLHVGGPVDERGHGLREGGFWGSGSCLHAPHCSQQRGLLWFTRVWKTPSPPIYSSTDMVEHAGHRGHAGKQDRHSPGPSILAPAQRWSIPPCPFLLLPPQDPTFTHTRVHTQMRHAQRLHVPTRLLSSAQSLFPTSPLPPSQSPG